MASHNVYTFFSVHNCLDEDFDAPDAMADAELGRAIIAGRCGVHPDGWGNHDPLPLRWLMRRRPERELPGFGQPLPVEHRSDVWHEHKPQPQPKPQPRRQPTRSERRAMAAALPPADWEPLPPTGEVKLTCDDCQARFRVTMHYRGNRPAVVQSIRLMGKDEGWTCIVGRDRCPGCSHIPPPEDVGHGAGQRQGDEQHG